MSEFPKEWMTTNLGYVAVDIQGGGTPPKNIAENFKGDIPFMTVKDMKTYRPSDTKDKITEAALQSCSSKLIPAGTPIVCTRMGLGKIVVASFATAINQDLKAVFLEVELVNIRYFDYWYRSMSKEINSMGTGTTVKGITLKQLKELQLPLPPVAEQTYIAQKVDELLALVDSLKARIDSILVLLKRFRQSVLAAAVSGRLTADWRAQISLPAETTTYKLGSIARFIDYRGKTPIKVDSGIPLITAKNIRQGYISREPREYIRSDDYEAWMTRGVPNVGDVLITTEAPLGNVAVIDISEKFALAQRAICMQFINEVNSKYVAIELQSSHFQEELLEKATGTTVKGIKASVLKEMDISCPPHAEQTEIVRRVEELFASSFKLEKKITSAKTRIDYLTQSVFSKAFSGELTAEWRAANPDLVSGKNSADALLAKIKAARETNKNKPKSTRTTSKKNNMNKLTKDELTAWVLNHPKAIFSFEDLKNSLSADYELLKDCLFDSLHDENPAFKQDFDKNTKSIIFTKVIR